MRRADRLFEIIQQLRRRRVVTARALADHFGISERTIYRDIEDLIASRVPIQGAPGMGYSLRKGYDLPPLMFTENELEALVFGARVVQSWSDAQMSEAADAALAKIETVLPDHLRRLLSDRSLWPSTMRRRPELTFDLAHLRNAVHSRRKVHFHYRDEKGAETERTVRPLTVLFDPPVWMTGAWCELRGDFRFFRLERMSKVQFLDDVFTVESGKTIQDLFTRMLGAS